MVLPAPLGPTSAITWPGRDRKLDLAQDLASLVRVAVVEADTLEAHLASDGRQLERVRVVLHLRRRVEQLEDPLACAQARAGTGCRGR